MLKIVRQFVTIFSNRRIRKNKLTSGLGLGCGCAISLPLLGGITAAGWEIQCSAPALRAYSKLLALERLLGQQHWRL